MSLIGLVDGVQIFPEHIGQDDLTEAGSQTLRRIGRNALSLIDNEPAQSRKLLKEWPFSMKERSDIGGGGLFYG